ncbi:MAG: ferritin-like domain-containing protein [Myxococcaceae bacterium]|nr:ferritin-like domain-containing protein [Myxococcaceae bacterium]
MTPDTLRTVLRRALKASLVAPLALSACGPDTSGYKAPLCENGHVSMAGLSPSVIPDVVELRQRSAFGGTEPAQASRLSGTGTACANATDKAACMTRFAGLSPTVGFAENCLDLCSSYFLATTRGDEVKAWTSLEELKAFLGTIDTAQEAALLAFANAYRPECGQLDRGAVRARSGGGYDVIATRGIGCGRGNDVTRHFLEVSAQGDVREVRSEVIKPGDPNCAIGRRPHGLASSGDIDCEDTLGRHFASAAHLEAASVDAFLRLRQELVLHGAPTELRGAAVLAALEEVRHAQVTSALAARFGAEVVAPRVEPRPLRGLFEVALDNAVEGCVRETYGALVAHHQAACAADPETREVMARIAEDETRHAELSWAIAAWAEPRLTDDQRAQLHQAQREAVKHLARALAEPIAPALVDVAGMPDAASARAMLDAMLEGLPALA